jgi:hypothetical protein
MLRGAARALQRSILGSIRKERIPLTINSRKRAQFHLLLPDCRLLNELLLKNYSLVAPFQALFHNGPGLSYHSTAHHEPFMVEVAHCLSVSVIRSLFVGNTH